VEPERKQTTRLTPAQFVIQSEKFSARTVLNYENTRHRYPWVCSLRSIGPAPEHLCAVTLLAVPPGPTVVIGSAHCTYLCKNENEAQVPSCCCNDGQQQDCSDDQMKCGEEPKVFDMTNDDVEVLCGEWETGSSPTKLSGEKYNVVLKIVKIIRHPNWKTKGDNAGPIGGSDLAIFKVEDSAIQNNTANSLRLWPACLPVKDVARKQIKTGIQTGWSKPPPFYFLQERAPYYMRYYRDFFKQWHYKMEILDKCKDPQTDAVNGLPLKFPANSSYPPGSVCAKDFSRQSCFSTGDSGSPLMVRDEKRPMRFMIEGILSFVKGCDVFSLGSINSKGDQLNQQTENPSTYTKLSCFLPWVAQQYDMEYEDKGPADPECYQGQGNPLDAEENKCRITPSALTSTVLVGSGENIGQSVPEPECIFPFFYRDKLFTKCTLFEEDGFVFPVFRCPTRNVTTKINGTNSFPSLGLTQGICPPLEQNILDPNPPLDPNLEDCPSSSRVIPFSQCKNNCPGVRAFGVIGGGAVLAAAAGISAISAISALAPVAGVGAVGVAGVGGNMVAQMMCLTPYCRAASGDCCTLTFSLAGPQCPETC